MKRVFYLIFIFCSIFLSVTIFLHYSDSIYNSVFQNKECIIIEKQENQDNQQFIDDIINISGKANSDIIYTTIENASASKPTYNIYTTSIASNFISLHTNYPNDNIDEKIHLTTNLDDQTTEYYVYGSTLYSHFNLYNMKDASSLELSHSKFYVDVSSCDAFLSALIDNDYEVSIVSDENRIEQSENMIELWIMFVILTVFMFFSAVCYAFSLRKTIVIKKANGYDEFSIFKTTFLKSLIFIPSVLVACSIISCVIVEIIYPNCFFAFFKYSIKYVFIYLLVSVVLSLFACLYVQFKKSAGEIRGNKASKSLYVLSLIIRFVVSLIVIWGLTCAVNAIRYHSNLNKTNENYSFMNEQYVVLSLNAGSVDFYNNTDEYMEKSKEFVQEISSQFETVIVDSIEFFDPSETYEKTLYISESYLEINPIYSTDGKLLDLSNICKDRITILLPENYSGETIKYATQNGIEFDTIYYASGQKFYTFNQYTAIETQGALTDPMVMILNDEELTWKAQSIIGEGFLLIKCNSQNPYEELKSIIDKAGLANVILEAQSLKTIFDVATTHAYIKMVQYSIVSVLYLIVLVIITLFESKVYYENNKRMLTIKKLHGFGYYAYKDFFFKKLLIVIALLIVSIILAFNCSFVIIAAIIDIGITMFYIRKLERNNISLYLKGDM